VTIPYAEALANLVPPLAVRLRRDFGALLSLIRAHAVLHQATRERDDRDKIVATLEDYAVVRELVSDLVSEGIEATVPKSVREAVHTVARLHAQEDSLPVGVVQVARELKLDRSAASRRVRSAKTRRHRRGQSR
jgi:cobalamin-dependent methionine synthase I